ncbi:PRN1 [Symbiodinium sp. CCMP2456]|nr:PRN1 [Symbiodinium sp. CCMP2456]
MAYGYGPKPAYHSKNYHKEALRNVYRRRLDHLGLKLQQLDLGGDVESTEREGVTYGNLLGSVQLPGSTQQGAQEVPAVVRRRTTEQAAPLCLSDPHR